LFRGIAKIIETFKGSFMLEFCIVSELRNIILPKEALQPPAHFQWRKNGKNADVLCDGIGLGMLSKVHPIKRDEFLKDIPDNKAFFSCVAGLWVKPS